MILRSEGNFKITVPMPTQKVRVNKVEITTIVEERIKVNECLSSYFIPADSFGKQRFFPLIGNLKFIGKEITLCNVPAIDCFAVKRESLYSFLLVIKNNRTLWLGLKSKFGSPHVETETSINHGATNKSYIWKMNELNIYLMPFYNPEKGEKYEDCVFVAIGNMKFSDLVVLQKK